MGLLKALALTAVRLRTPFSEEHAARVQELVSLRQLLVRENINCVFDVGANRGQFAGELRGIGYRGRIVSFEPVRAEFEVLEKRFAGDRDWRGLRMALGRERKQATIHVFPQLPVFSSMLKRSGLTVG